MPLPHHDDPAHPFNDRAHPHYVGRNDPGHPFNAGHPTGDLRWTLFIKAESAGFPAVALAGGGNVPPGEPAWRSFLELASDPFVVDAVFSFDQQENEAGRDGFFDLRANVQTIVPSVA